MTNWWQLWAEKIARALAERWSRSPPAEPNRTDDHPAAGQPRDEPESKPTDHLAKQPRDES